MARTTYALWTVGTGLLLGLWGNILFYGRLVGLSVPLFTLMMLGVLLASRYILHGKIRHRNLWIIVPVLFFAAMIAVRADPVTTSYNGLALVLLGALTLHYFSVNDPLDTEPLGDYLANTINAGKSLALDAPAQYKGVFTWIRRYALRDSALVMAIGRGLLITVPVIVVFAVLLSAADFVFAGYVKQIGNLFSTHVALQITERGIITLCLAWAATGALGYLRQDRPAFYLVIGDESAELPDEPVKKRKRTVFHLGIIESGMVLGSVAAMFGVFILIQFSYFFGGEANITAEGYTYADYARRGFFELLTVSVMTLALLLTLDALTLRPGRREQSAFHMLALVIVGMMFIIVFAASRRMALYEDAYGFTHLRVYSHVCIWWVAVMFIVFVLHLFRVRPHVFSLGLLLVAIGYLGTLNILNVDHYIARHNVERYLNGQPLDLCFLTSLSLDALPVMVDLHETTTLNQDTTVHAYVSWWLATKRTALNTQENSVFSFNLTRHEARTALAGLDDLQPSYEYQINPYRCANTSYRR